MIETCEWNEVGADDKAGSGNDFYSDIITM